MTSDTSQPLGEPAAEREVRELGPLLEWAQPLTTTPWDALIDVARLVPAVLRFGIPGAFVEYGGWRGGAGFFMADLLCQTRVQDGNVWLFDSFEGLPPPQEIDGAAALHYTADTDSPDYQDVLRASFEEVQRTTAEFGLTRYTECVKGWFEETLPACRERIGPIAVLRVDGNWYSSVRCSLEALGGWVVDDGFVICHTYYTSDGCAKAVHEFLGKRCLPSSVEGKRSGEAVEDYLSALFDKGETTWKWLRQVYLATQDIESVVPRGRRQPWPTRAHWGRRLAAVAAPCRSRLTTGNTGPRRMTARPFETFRVCARRGGHFLAFAWPAFWWLDYYAELHRYLRAEFRCMLENARTIVFDLRPVLSSIVAGK